MRKDKVLFELGDWQVRHQPFFSFNSNAYNALHTSCATSGLARHIASWYSSEPPICSGCDAPVPDEIQGILVMLIAGSPIEAW